MFRAQFTAVRMLIWGLTAPLNKSGSVPERRVLGALDPPNGGPEGRGPSGGYFFASALSAWLSRCTSTWGNGMPSCFSSRAFFAARIKDSRTAQ